SAPGPPANPPGCRRDVRASHLRPGAPMIGRVIPAHPPGRPHRAPFAIVLLAVLAWAGLAPGIVHAQSLDANLWVTDGEVAAIVPWGNTLYIGGSFLPCDVASLRPGLYFLRFEHVRGASVTRLAVCR